MSAPRTMSKYMIATQANHTVMDISRPVEDGDYSDNLCHIYHEDEENYIGAWVTGAGFYDVRFPKTTTRELTNAEIEFFNSKTIRIGSQPPVPLNVGETMTTTTTTEPTMTITERDACVFASLMPQLKKIAKKMAIAERQLGHIAGANEFEDYVEDLEKRLKEAAETPEFKAKFEERMKRVRG